MPPVRPINPLRFHAPTREHYTWDSALKKRAHLGRDFAEAQKRYARLVAAWRGEVQAPAPPPGSPVTVSELLLAYYRHRKRDGVGARDLARLRTACRFARKHHGAEPAAAFRARQLRSLRDLMLRSPGGRRVKPAAELKAPRKVSAKGPVGAQVLSRRYVNRLVTNLKAAWEWAAGEDLVPAETAVSLRLVKGLRKGKAGREVKRVRAVEAWAVEATLPELNPVVRAMVRLQQLAGMRPGELCALRRRDVSTSPAERVPLPETDDHLAAFQADGGTLVWLAVPESHKTLWRGHKPRAVVLGPRAQAVLAPFLAGRKPDDYLFSAREASDVVRSARGQKPTYGRGREPKDRYTTQSYGRSVAYAVERVNRWRAGEDPPGRPVPAWRPNQLRKHAATEAAEHFDRSAASAVLGNSMSVIDVYCAGELRKAARVAAAIG